MEGIDGMIKRIWCGSVVALLLAVVTGCGVVTSQPSPHAKSCPSGTVSTNENGTIHCFVTRTTSPLSLRVTTSDAPGGIRIQWTAVQGRSPSTALVYFQTNGSHTQMQSVANGGVIAGLAIGAHVHLVRIQTSSGTIGWVAPPNSSTLSYGAFALWGNVSPVANAPTEAILTVQYNKTLPNQVPSQTWNTYHVTAFGANIPPGQVIRATVTKGQLQLVVKFVSNSWGAPLILRTTSSTAHTVGGAPVSSYVVAY